MRSRKTHFLEDTNLSYPNEHGFSDSKDCLLHLLYHYDGSLEAWWGIKFQYWPWFQQFLWESRSQNHASDIIQHPNTWKLTVVYKVFSDDQNTPCFIWGNVLGPPSFVIYINNIVCVSKHSTMKFLQMIPINNKHKQYIQICFFVVQWTEKTICFWKKF